MRRIKATETIMRAIVFTSKKPYLLQEPLTRPVLTDLLYLMLEVSHSYSLFFDDSGVCNAPCVVFVHQGGGWRDRYINAATFVRVGYLARTNRSKLS